MPTFASDAISYCYLKQRYFPENGLGFLFWEWPQRQRLWCSNGNHPFGALLVDADGNVVLEAENTVVTERDCTGHTESNLMRMANARFNPEFLRRRTLYTSTEPCAICAGAIYWGNVRRVVFALSRRSCIASAVPPKTPPSPCPAGRCLREASRRSRSAAHLREQARAVPAGFWDTRR